MSDHPPAGAGADATRIDPTRVVADADVLAADLLVGGSAREAMDVLRAHSWLTLVVSDPLIRDAVAVVEALSDAALAADWRERLESLGERVEHRPGDHPALACAHHGRAPHVLSFDESLLSVEAGAGIRSRVETSVKRPNAFVRLLDPKRFYESAVGGDYPGPDRDPRA